MSDHAKSIIAGASTASLGTIGGDGRPFVSMITVAELGQGHMITLLSGLAQHTKNLNMHADVSLLLVEPGGIGGDPLAGARLTVSGSVKKLDKNGPHRATFLAKHPAAEIYIDFADFELYEVVPDEAYLVAGFGRIESIPASEL